MVNASTGQIRRAAAPQVFKARASLVRFTQFFPLILAGIGVGVVAGVGIGYYFHMWLIPLFMALPLVSTGLGAAMANRMSKSCVVIDQAGLKLLQGKLVQAAVGWNQVTRLTVRQDRGDNVYEVWVRNRPIALPAAYYEHGDQLLAAVSSRTNRPWERQREGA